MHRLAIARRIRRHAERLLSREYGSDLCGACGICSAALAREFRRAGYAAKVKEGWFDNARGSCHCWVESGRYIYDLTAGQFGRFPKVMIVRLGDKRYRDGRNPHWPSWPDDQRPTHQRIRHLLRGAEDMLANLAKQAAVG